MRKTGRLVELPSLLKEKADYLERLGRALSKREELVKEKEKELSIWEDDLYRRACELSEREVDLRVAMVGLERM